MKKNPTCDFIVDLIMLGFELLDLLDLVLDQRVDLVPGQTEWIYGVQIHWTIILTMASLYHEHPHHKDHLHQGHADPEHL